MTLNKDWEERLNTAIARKVSAELAYSRNSTEDNGYDIALADDELKEAISQATAKAEERGIKRFEAELVKILPAFPKPGTDLDSFPILLGQIRKILAQLTPSIASKEKE